MSAQGTETVSIDLGDVQVVVEKIAEGESGQKQIRLWIKRQQQASAGALELTERELAMLLQKAVRAGVLSPGFIAGLHSEVEI